MYPERARDRNRLFPMAASKNIEGQGRSSPARSGDVVGLLVFKRDPSHALCLTNLDWFGG